MKLGVDWISMAILLVAYVFSRVPGVHARLGNSGLAIACGVIAYRYYLKDIKIQFNLVMMGVACAFALYYLFKAATGAGAKKAPPPDDD
jgi:hypothetical protein